MDFHALEFVKFESIDLCYNNQNSIKILYNYLYHFKTKYFKIYLYYIHDIVT